MHAWKTILFCLALLLLLAAGDCSRARVESTNHMNEGVALAQQKQYLEAVKKIEQAVAIDSSNDQAYWNLAIIHIEMKKFERAKEELRKAIAVNPGVAGYHEKLGSVLMELGDWAAAKQAVEKALSVEGGLFKAHYKLAQISERTDDEQSALDHYTAAIQKGPRFIEAYLALGRLYADLDFPEQSLQVLGSAQQVVHPGSEEQAHIYLIMGTVQQQQKNHEMAIKSFRAALDIMPGLSEALFSLGWTYAENNNFEEARRFLKKYVETAADAPEHYLKAARDRIRIMSEGY